MKYGYLANQANGTYRPDLLHALGLPSYELCTVAPDELSTFLAKTKFSGINVASNYKEAVIPYLDEMDENATAVGAVNTILKRAGRLKGYNTNVDGFRIIFRKFGMHVTDRKVLIAGTGPLARAAAYAASKLDVKEIVMISRTPGENAVSYEQARTEHGDAEIFINTTPIGMYPNVTDRPINVDDFPKLRGVIDTVFNPLRTALIQDARSANIPVCPGICLFATQAGIASSLFLNTRFTIAKLREAYRALCDLENNIVLVGLPNSPREEVARILSERTGRPIIDTVQMVEKKSGRSVYEITQSDSESSLHALESDVISSIAATTRAILITGNGLTSRPENVRYLAMNGTLFFINTTPDLLNEVKPGEETLAQSHLYGLYRQRVHGFLTCSDEQVNGDCEPEEIADNILKLFNQDCLKKHGRRRR